MLIRIDGLVWLPLDSLDVHQVDNIKIQLTVYPKRTTDIELRDPPPIFMFEETPTHIGVPREWYRKFTTKQHDEVLDVSYARMRDLPTVYQSSGHYAEQEDAIRVMRNQIEGREWGGVLLKAGCGFGKTAVALEFARQLGFRTLILVHKEFFLDQWKKRIEYFIPDARIGIVRQSKCEYEGKDFVIAMLQSLTRDSGEKYPEELYRAFGLVISDECFIGSTEIMTRDGMKRIDTVKRGDIVFNAIGEGEVQHVSEREVEICDLRLVRTVDGHECICTKDHPWLTDSGWLDSGDISQKSVLTMTGCIGIMLEHGNEYARYMSDLWEAKFGEEWKEVLLSKVYRPVEDCCDSSVRDMRRACKTESESFLFRLLSGEMDGVELRRNSSKSFESCEAVARGESMGKVRGVGSDEGIESHEDRISKGEGVKCAEVDGALSKDSRWERSFCINSAENVDGSSRARMDHGVYSSHRSQKSKSYEDSKSLQDRYCVPGEDDSDRGRRWISSIDEGKGCRQEEVRIPRRIGVESVSIPKQEDLERFGICSFGDRANVFNLKVSGHPSYVLSNGVVVHNCHRVAAATWSSVIYRFNAAWRLGLSATPRRKDGTQDVFFNHISDITYSAKTEAMTPALRTLNTSFRLHPIVRGRYRVDVDNLNTAQILTQIGEDEFRAKDVVDQLVLALKAGRKIMVVSERISHLKMMSDMLAESIFNMDLPFVPKMGFYTGEWYTGEKWETSTKSHRKGDPKLVKRTRADLDRAETCNVIFTTKQMTEEGLDIEALDVLVLSMPMGDVEQVVGRVRRWCVPEKSKCERLCPWRAGKCQEKPVPIVMDVVDVEVPQLEPKTGKRRRFYRQIGTL